MSLEKILGVDKVYCISLQRNQSNWPSLLNNISKNGFPSCEIYQGVDGRSYKSKLSGIVGVWEQYIIENNITRTNHEQFTTLGAIGCYLSHSNIWRDMITNGYKKVLIFEDDIWFNLNFIENLQMRLNYIPEDYDVLFLDIAKSFTSTDVNKYFSRINHLFFGMHSYIMTENAAKILIPQLLPIEVQIDSYLSYMGNLNNLNMYFTRGICGQQLHFSSIQTPCKACDIKQSGSMTYDIILLFFILLLLIVIMCVIKPELFFHQK